MSKQFSVDKNRLRSLVDRFSGKRVLVIGDMVADEYLIGNPTRISREAPVLILELFEERTVPGGAANVAVNARSLGAEVFLAGVVGDDLPGSRLRKAIEQLSMAQEGVLTDPQRPTSTKTRIMAGSSQLVRQHIVRIDRVDTSDVDGPYLSQLIHFQGVTAITPNQPEAEATLKTTIKTQAELNEAGQRLLEGSNAQSILITRGSEGMSLFVANEPPLHLPIHKLNHGSEIVDTNGAGDTVAATFTLALTAGATFAEAAYLANAAAALVVRRLGCASNTPEELLSAIL